MLLGVKFNLVLRMEDIINVPGNLAGWFIDGISGKYGLEGVLTAIIAVIFIFDWAFIAELSRKRCPYCKEVIDVHATMCPKCQSTLERAIHSEYSIIILRLCSL